MNHLLIFLKWYFISAGVVINFYMFMDFASRVAFRIQCWIWRRQK